MKRKTPSKLKIRRNTPAELNLVRTIIFHLLVEKLAENTNSKDLFHHGRKQIQISQHLKLSHLCILGKERLWFTGFYWVPLVPRAWELLESGSPTPKCFLQRTAQRVLQTSGASLYPKLVIRGEKTKHLFLALGESRQFLWTFLLSRSVNPNWEFLEKKMYS